MSHAILRISALLLLAGCAAAVARVQAEDLAARVQRYAADRDGLARFYPLDATPARAERLERRAREELAALSAVDFDALDLAGKVDHVLLAAELEHEIAEHADQAARLARLGPLLGFAGDLAALEEARWRAAPLDPRGAAGELARLADEVAAVMARAAAPGAEAPPEDALEVAPADALWAAARVDGLARALSGWRQHYEAFAPDFAWWCAKPADELEEALAGLAKRLREEIAGAKGEDDDPIVGDPIGAEALERDLAHELVAYTALELLDVAERELAWCEAELRAAAAEMGFEGDWRAALERVKEDHAEPGGQDTLVAGLVLEMIAWLDERELVSIPELCRETWRIRMIPREQQRFFPFAFYGGQEVDVAYPTADMDHEDKRMAMRGNNRAFTRCVTPHELIPGHHLQAFQSARFATHRRPFYTPFYVEGWALHWEMLQWDLGWARTPEERIGMLFWRMHRAARVVVSLGFHLGRTTPDEMIAFLVERVGHEHANAKAEVRRYVGGGYGPLYQCAYLIGGLQIRALRNEMVASGRMSDRDFHDAVLASGPIPIEMVRALLRGEAPEREFVPRWRFADGVSADEPR